MGEHNAFERLILKPLLPGQESLELSVRQIDYQQIVPGQHRVSLAYRDGYFGIKWIKGYRIEKPDPAAN